MKSMSKEERLMNNSKKLHFQINIDYLNNWRDVNGKCI